MEGYAELRAGFLKCHENETNALIHIVTGLLGVAGALSFVRAKSQNFTLVLAVFVYAVALLSSSAPLPVVVVVIASLAVFVVPLVKRADLGESV